MTTRRERLERKLERREEWAAGAERKSEAAFGAVQQICDSIPLGQPILVGHHSERHARRDQERIHRGMDRGCELASKAKHHSSKADGLARQLDRSVFSDDADAIEQLEARIAERETERDRMKAANAAWRKAGKPAPDAGEEAWATFRAAMGDDVTRQAVRNLAHEGRSDSGKWVAFTWAKPFPAYALTNLGANIRRDRERIKEIVRRQQQTEKAEAAGGVVIERCGDGGEWCTVTFAEKPERAILAALRAAGYGWGAGRWGGRYAALPAEVAALAAAPSKAEPAETAEEEADPEVYACPDGARCTDPECLAENERRRAAAGRYAVLCDDCKTELRRTDSMPESAAGGLCNGCREANREAGRRAMEAVTAGQAARR